MTKIKQNADMNSAGTKIIEFIGNQASGKMTMFFLVLQLMMGGLMFGVVYRFSSLAPGMMPLDLVFFYGVEDALRYFATIPDAAAQLYLHVLLPLDFIFPALYSFSFALIVAYMLERLARRGYVYPQWLVLYSLAAALFDYLENIGMIMMFHLQPLLPHSLVLATSMCSAMKWAIAFSGSIILMYLSFKLFTTRPRYVGRLF